MLIIRKKAIDIIQNELVFSAQEDKDGKMRYTTALVTQKYIHENFATHEKSICFHLLDTWKPDAEPQLMVLPAEEELLIAINHRFLMFFWFIIGTIITSLIWLAAIYLIR